jgi:hypothetical protein
LLEFPDPKVSPDLTVFPANKVTPVKMALQVNKDLSDLLDPKEFPANLDPREIPVLKVFPDHKDLSALKDLGVVMVKRVRLEIPDSKGNKDPWVRMVCLDLPDPEVPLDKMVSPVVPEMLDPSELPVSKVSVLAVFLKLNGRLGRKP